MSLAHASPTLAPAEERGTNPPTPGSDEELILSGSETHCRFRPVPEDSLAVEQPERRDPHSRCTP